MIVTADSARGAGVAELTQRAQLIGQLVTRELKVRYKRSFFGLLWTLINPLVQMIVYSVVFSTIMRTAQKNYAVFLLAGLLPWVFFSTAVLQGAHAVLGNQDLIRKIRLPQAVFPLSVVGSNLVNFTLSLVPLFLVMLVVGQPITPAVLFLPVSMLLLTVFTSGVTLLFATVTVFFRDVRYLLEIALQALFYLSPVIYGIAQLETAKGWWVPMFMQTLRLNPLTPLLAVCRDPVYYGTVPSLETIGAATGWALLAAFVGLRVFRRFEPRHIHHF